MKAPKFLLAILVVFLTFETKAQTVGTHERSRSESKLFIEPGVTYEFSNTTIDYPGPFATSDGNVSGLGIFAKVGTQINDLFFAGLDGRYSRPTLKDSTHNLEASANSYNFALLGGVKAPLGLRFMASWVFVGQINPGTYSNGVNLNYPGASGFRLGAGMKFLLVSVNFEYQNIKYDTEVEALGPFDVNTSFSNSKLSNESFVASLSVPLVL